MNSDSRRKVVSDKSWAEGRTLSTYVTHLMAWASVELRYCRDSLRMAMKIMTEQDRDSLRTFLISALK